MSFWKSLFGGGAAEAKPPRPGRREEYNGFVIEALEMKEGGQYQLTGRITKTVDGAAKEHTFIRADRFASLEDAETFTMLKARQIIDQSGDKLFR